MRKCCRENHRGNSLRVKAVKMLDNLASHGKAAEMSLVGFKIIEQASEIMAKIFKVQFMTVVIACAVSAGIPSGHSLIGR